MEVCLNVVDCIDVKTTVVLSTCRNVHTVFGHRTEEGSHVRTDFRGIGEEIVPNSSDSNRAKGILRKNVREGKGKNLGVVLNVFRVDSHFRSRVEDFGIVHGVRRRRVDFRTTGKKRV